MWVFIKTAVSKYVSEDKKQKEEKHSNKSRHGTDYGKFECSFNIWHFNYFDIRLLEPEEDVETCLQALKFDNLTSNPLDATWKACCKFV